MDVDIPVDVSKNQTDLTSCTSQTVDLTKGANKTNDIKQSYFVVYTGIVGETCYKIKVSHSSSRSWLL